MLTIFWTLSYILLVVRFSIAENSTNLSKRGLVYIGTSHPSDYQLFTSRSSPLTWYYTFATWPALSHSSLDFAPMIHGTLDAADAVPSIKSMASSGGITHVLVYNEPDGSTESGGSNLTPDDAARTYLDTIAPLRDAPYNLKMSLPSTTGSPNGLNWLREFNSSCHNITSGGCPSDFLAAHWYGGFPGLASWLGTLHQLYPTLPIWLTEFALPAFPENITYDFVNQTISYLDQLDYVERYSYFGTFRREAANNFTGPNVAMLDDSGSLTRIGALYLGGNQTGFAVGMKGMGGRTEPVLSWLALAVAVVTAIILA
ncbi:hypothetical protein NA57DRAFT_70503 [Rhizodiscina lignyota]|uniref:Asl1-like glycosyl hydrolase catalytic domain-containing protein n=1 Tax=Rhizodiscina lignyota TaxID=1504668 RepID=A0A9P4MBE5_9PEZI|nr:hypothetical protein NA57DRAFT_70503 [Rhizodiscina lignyota]